MHVHRVLTEISAQDEQLSIEQIRHEARLGGAERFVEIRHVQRRLFARDLHVHLPQIHGTQLIPKGNFSADILSVTKTPIKVDRSAMMWGIPNSLTG